MGQFVEIHGGRRPFRFAAEAMLRAGQFSGSQGNAFEGEVGFDYAGFSFDVIGSKIDDAVSSNTLNAAQLTTVSTTLARPRGCSRKRLRQHRRHGSRQYAIGPVKLYGGYERIDQKNPNNPCRLAASCRVAMCSVWSTTRL